MASMLPASCDPGYAELGVNLGVPVLQKQAELFGYNAVPGIDLPGVVPSVFPTLPTNSQALLGQSAIGQYNVAATASERHGRLGGRQQRRRDDPAPDVGDP